MTEPPTLWERLWRLDRMDVATVAFSTSVVVWAAASTAVLLLVWW